jgi:hypothetical protein
MFCPAGITANALLVWIVFGFCVGLGLAVAWNLVGIPFRRWAP